MPLSDSPGASAPLPIVVAGDVSIDWLAWPQQAAREIRNANWRQREGTRMVARRGGALLLADLLAEAIKHQPVKRDVIGPQVKDLAQKTPEEHLHSLVDLKPIVDAKSSQDGTKRFGVAQLRGFSGPEAHHPPQPPMDGNIGPAAVLVLDDSGNGFRDDVKASWKNLITQTRPGWLVLKMSRPLAVGPMWDWLRNDKIPDKPNPERVIIVLNADDLRAEAIALSRRQSWERSVEDFVRELDVNPTLKALADGGHLVVRFDCDGVIYHHHSGRETKLFFDPNYAEGEFVENTGLAMVGITDAFTSGLAVILSENDATLDKAIRRGMTAAHRMAKAGFRAEGKGAPDYPHRQAMLPYPEPFLGYMGPDGRLIPYPEPVFGFPGPFGARRESDGRLMLEHRGRDPRPEPERAIIAVIIPRGRISAGQRWSIVNDQLGKDVPYAARRMITIGPAFALAKVPVAKFGELETADRYEIESFRAIGNLLRDHLAERRTKPISIAVFGPPGSGKSFGVQQVVQNAKLAASGRATSGSLNELEKPLEFNLSQFTKLDDLIAAFHLVRDRVLSGIVPLVFFDEFDCTFEDSELGWLRYFLAPMQDGVFREHGYAHPLGGAIFAFAGGTRQNLKDFVKTQGDPKYDEFVAAKGPDFASRLRGYIDIRGSDQVGDDLAFQIRRAFLLRSMLSRREKQLASGDGFDIDDGVLNALLTVGSYRHGARSMEAVLGMSTLTRRRQFERAALPSAEQLESHVNAAEFIAQVKDERLEGELREPLGRALHEAYRVKRKAIADSDEERKKLEESDASMKDWSSLDEMFRESSRLQADDIPHKLRLIDCDMAKARLLGRHVDRFTDEEVRFLAEREHERFNAERLRQQWRLGDRDAAKRTSPFLIPWDELDEKWRQLDVAAVTAIPKALADVGWRVYRRKR